MQVTGSQNFTLQISSSAPAGRRSPAIRESLDKILDPKPTRSSKRDILFDSFNASRTPTLEAVGTVALFRARDAVRFLSLRADHQPVSVSERLEKTSRFRELQADRLNVIKTSLQNLQNRISRLQDEDFPNIRRGTSSQPDVVDVAAGRNSPVGHFSIRAGRLAEAHVLVSDEQTAPLGALGLSGSFSVNGTRVTVEATDSLLEIRNKINFGEDINRNGILDGPEDLNGNNALDIYEVEPSEFGPGVYINEDLNGNEALDGSEDSNHNERLDGGVTETNVVASIRGNRLQLTSLAGSDTRIDLQDEDDVLLGLGFFELNGKGNSVLKERQFDAGNPPVNLNRNPQNARIEVDGNTVSNPSNVFQNVAEDTTLVLKKTSERQARIDLFIDASQVVSQVKSLFTQFNAAVTTLNDVLVQDRSFGRDPDLQNIRQDLTGSLQEKTRALNRRNRIREDVLGARENPGLLGIEVKNSEKSPVQELSLTAIAQSLRSGSALNFKSAERQLTERLSAIGIKTLEDDTFIVDGNKLDRALSVNSEEVLDLLNNPESGILPLLGKQLNRILDPGLGDIDLKKQNLSLSSNRLDRVADKVRRFEENSRLQLPVQTLIAVA